MKKFTLLLVSGLIAGSSFAQRANHSLVRTAAQDREAVRDYVSAIPAGNHTAVTANKGAGAPTARWYSQFDLYDNLLNGAVSDPNNVRLQPIFFDSTVRQRYSTGYGAINYISVAQVIDPISSATLFNDPSVYGGETAVRTASSYRVDSVFVQAAYVRIKTTPNIVDTLIMSVAPNTLGYYYRATTYPVLAPYLPSGKDTFRTFEPTSVDSINRAAYSDVSGTNRILWKVPLTAAMGDTIDATGSITYRVYPFAVPGGLTVPAGGNRVAYTVTFKTGSPYVKNVDSFNKINNFRIINSTPGGTNSQMPYRYYDDGDRNGSSNMFYNDSSYYEYSGVTDAFSTSHSFSYEFHSMGVKVLCLTNCAPVSVGTINDVIGGVSAFPNPARNTINVSMKLKMDANITLTVSNTMGQTLSTQDLGKVQSGTTKTATVSTENLASGIYFYTVEANGARTTSRFVVTH